MSGHTKIHPTNPTIKIILMLDNKETSYSLPETPDIKKKLLEITKFCEKKAVKITPWKKATPWEKLAADRIKRYTKAGLVLRGARMREGYSQKMLAKRCGISQENLSRMENGKRPIGKKVAEKLAKALHIDSSLLLKLKAKNSKKIGINKWKQLKKN
jgi:ribosome-binding protein aMBF1 (putative translation factor)